MALIGLVIAVMDRNMIDNRKIEKRIEHNKHHMNYRSCLFYFHSLLSFFETCHFAYIFLSNSINILSLCVYLVLKNTEFCTFSFGYYCYCISNYYNRIFFTNYYLSPIRNSTTKRE